MDSIKYSPAGDQGILINFGSCISTATNKQIRGIINNLNNRPIKGVIEVIPSYTSLLVLYDRKCTSYDKLLKKLKSVIAVCGQDAESPKIVHHIPVCYEEAFAPDLKDVSKHTGLSESEIIDIHTGSDYLIYMLGFLPGFAYLGGMDSRIACPRLSTPRTKIPAGGVGIGGEQTGIYPLSSPGGWRIIGQTPLTVYDPNRDPSILYQMGEYIRFESISFKEYEEIEAQVKAGKYSHTVKRENS